MNGYTKLFADIVTSTIWNEPNDCRVLWITMLAMKERDNIVRATVPFLAKASNISLESCEAYLEKFQQPDKYSRSQEHEGRRISSTEGGWLILNGQKYQDKLNGEHRKEQVREAVARHRAKLKPRKKRAQHDKLTNGFHPRDDRPHKLGCPCEQCVALSVSSPEI